jgi:hypothetical protein
MTIVEVSSLLDRQGVPHAVIGAVALAVHGVLRASADTDVLVTDRRCLDATIWDGLTASGVMVDARRGDADDPLAGVVRLTPPSGTRIDIVVGRSRWQDDLLARAQRVSLMGTLLPVALPVDLVLLKLYAGCPQDAWDVDQLLDAVPGLESEVAPALPVLPNECAALWRRIVAGRTPP